jgi:glycosyltransferase involved in cell wall biosynthesis
VDIFRSRYGISRPYFLISGVRDGPKNAELFFRAFERLGPLRSEFAVVCTNANMPLEPPHALMTQGADVHMVVLNDEELQCAFSGAAALVYPSRYEGFGLPVLEAMACHCPVITCRNSSISEVGGEAVIYVDPDNVDEMQSALTTVLNPKVRQDLIAKGADQAAKFSWAKMARGVGHALAQWAIESNSGSTP